MTVPKRIAEEGLLSTADVAKRLNVHRTTVWLYIKRGMLVSTQLGVFHGVKESDLRAFMAAYPISQREKPTKRKTKNS